jgi:cytochrome c oxidase assembly protein subunit 15
MYLEPTKTPGLWLHRWALLTVAATAVQLAIGAVVTSFQVGMADPVWPSAPWYLFQIKWGDQSLGFLIEHSHRFTGSLVGLCAIVLAAWLWLREPRLGLRFAGLFGVTAMVGTLALCFARLDRGTPTFTPPELVLLGTCLAACLVAVTAFLVVALRLRQVGVWLRWLGTAALAGIICQGLLGGFRVKLNVLAGTDLAIVHGCFAQVIFALLVSLAVATAPGWVVAFAAPTAAAGTLRRWSLLLVGLVFLQLVFGALVRHTHSPLWGRFHLLTAFAVAAAVVVLVMLVFGDVARQRPVARTVVFLVVLVGVQLLLGVEAWMIEFSSGELPELVQVTLPRAIVRTAHVLTGASILATAVVPAVQARRRAPAAEPLPADAGRLEGVA